MNDRMWLLYFVNGFNQSITGNLAPYITSEFEAHSLVPLIQVVSSIMGAATYMPLAKILNLWDRSVGFALMAGFATLGLILAASCKGIGVYCASQVRESYTCARSRANDMHRSSTALGLPA